MALKPKQQRALECLMREPTIEAAAKASGVSRASLFRWLRSEPFCDELRRSQDEVLAASVRRLTTLSATACDVLRDAMAADVLIGIRLRAADVALGKLLHLKEFAELETRISELEKQHELRATN